MSNTIFDHIDSRTSEDEIQSYKDLLVGDGKKFKDDEALARGKYESDRFIENLQREHAELRQELNSRLNMEDLVSKLGKTASTQTPISVVQESPTNPNPTVQPINPDDLASQVSSIVRNTMTAEQVKRVQENNLNAVATQLKQVWGDNWVDKLVRTGDQLGISKEQMDTLAKTAPKVLLASVMREPQKVDNVSPPRSSLMGSPTPTNTDKGWQAYEKLRKESPREYYSQRVQMQLHKDVQAGKIVLPSN